MKCPKCGYLGFETTDRCRNCGYDFSLSLPGRTPTELPLHSSDGGSALADFDLDSSVAGPGHDSSVDADRLIGTTAPGPAGTQAMAEALPLFPQESGDDAPLITTPRPPRAPLSVRRTTPDRGRTRLVTAAPQPDLGIQQLDAVSEWQETEKTPDSSAVERVPPLAAGPYARIAAAVIDLLLLATIDSSVVYLTLAMAGLGVDGLASVPLVPLLAFLALLDGGYLVAFVAASGQTIGKMAAGIRVMGDDGRRVDIGGAVLRAAGCGLSAVTLGLGYLPAFVTSDGRALHDRIAGTRVVSAG